MSALKYGKVKSVDRQAYRRSCDVCGHNWPFSKLRYIGQGRWACPDDEKGLTAEQIARHQARMRPLIVRPRRHARLQGSTPMYQGMEAKILRLVIDHGLLRSSISANGGGTITSDAGRTSLCALYLSEVILDGQRPAAWITEATTALRAFVDFILTQQYGSLTGPSPAQATNTLQYGGIRTSATTLFFEPTTAIYGGLALVRAYRIFGDQTYLDAANRVATFIRQSLQRRDAVTVQFSSDAGLAARVYYGGLIRQLSATTGLPGGSAAAVMNLNMAAAMWFLTELRTVVGGSTVYGLASPSGDFTLANSGTLDQMLSEMRAFYCGNKISGWSKAPTSGVFAPMSMLSKETPRSGLNTFTAALGNDGLYALTGGGSPSIASSNVTTGLLAAALRGLFEYEGYSATVAGIYEWLMSFASNPLNEPTAGMSAFALANTTLGVFDPELALPLAIQVQDASGNPIAQNMAFGSASTSNDYDIASTALLAPVRAASGRDSRSIKDAIDKAYRVRASGSDSGLEVGFPVLRGAMGLSRQMFGLVTQSTFSILPTGAALVGASTTGLLYRAAPAGYPLLKGLP